MNKKNKVILFDIDYTVFDTDVFKKSDLTDYLLYDEVLDTLTKLSKIATLGVFSEGEIAFQRKKLQETNIEKYFSKDHIYLVAKKADMIEKMLSKYQNSAQLFLVDDKLTILALAKIHYPGVFTVWVKRGIYAISQKPITDFTPWAEVEKLDEIVNIIKNV